MFPHPLHFISSMARRLWLRLNVPPDPKRPSHSPATRAANGDSRLSSQIPHTAPDTAPGTPTSPRTSRPGEVRCNGMPLHRIHQPIQPFTPETAVMSAPKTSVTWYVPGDLLRSLRIRVAFLRHLRHPSLRLPLPYMRCRHRSGYLSRLGTWGGGNYRSRNVSTER